MPKVTLGDLFKGTFEDFYEYVKDDADNCEKELENCKKWLETSWLLACARGEKPWYVENLLESFSAENVDKRDLGKTLDYLWSDLSETLPLHDWIEHALTNPSKARSQFEFLKRFRKAVDAYLHFAFLMIQNQKAYDAFQRIREKHPDNMEGKLVDAYRAETGRLSYLDSFWGDLLGEKVLGQHLAYSSVFFFGSFSVLLDLAFGSSMVSAVFLRPAMEFAMKGMLLEHLSDQKYVLDVKSVRGRPGDVVPRLVFLVEEWAREQKCSLKNAIRTFEFSPKQSAGDPGFDETIDWLCEWKVFESIPNARTLLRQLKKKFNQDIHISSVRIVNRRILDDTDPEPYVDETTLVLDILICGAFGTTRNLNPEGLKHLLQDKWLDYAGKEENRTVREELVQIAAEAHLDRTAALLKTVCI